MRFMGEAVGREMTRLRVSIAADRPRKSIHFRVHGADAGSDRQKKKTRNACGSAGCEGITGGEGGIRTHGRRTPTPDFESGTIDHAATSPTVRIVAPLVALLDRKGVSASAVSMNN